MAPAAEVLDPIGTSLGPAASHPAALAAVAIGLGPLLLSLLSVSLIMPARAQRVIPKLDPLCPLGSMDTLNGKCSTLGLMHDTVAPAEGRACPEGWMAIGGGYCRQP